MKHIIDDISHKNMKKHTEKMVQENPIHDCNVILNHCYETVIKLRNYKNSGNHLYPKYSYVLVHRVIPVMKVVPARYCCVVNLFPIHLQKLIIMSKIHFHFIVYSFNSFSFFIIYDCEI